MELASPCVDEEERGTGWGGGRGDLLGDNLLGHGGIRIAIAIGLALALGIFAGLESSLDLPLF